MTQKKDNTKKLKSVSTGNLCNVAQYVAELVCLRKAERDNKGSLEYKFWNKSKSSQYETEVNTGVGKTFKLLESQPKEEKKVLDVPDRIEYKKRKPFSKQSTLFSKIRDIEDDKRKKT